MDGETSLDGGGEAIILIHNSNVKGKDGRERGEGEWRAGARKKGRERDI